MSDSHKKISTPKPSSTRAGEAKYGLLKAEAAQRLEEIIIPIVESLGLTLVAVRLVQQGKRRVLSVTIHKKGGKVSLDDCENVSRKVDELLEANADEEIISGAYSLEVESPGLNRVLKNKDEFAIFQGEDIELTLKDPIEGLGTTFRGRLIGLLETHVKVESPTPVKRSEKSGKGKKTEEKSFDQSEISVPLDSLSSVRLYSDMSFGNN